MDMLIQIAAAVVTVVTVVVAAFFVPTLIHLRRMAEESERLLRRMNDELPVLFQEVTQAAQNLNHGK